MSLDSLHEAFERLNRLTEDVFDVSGDGISSLKDFIDNDELVDKVQVIDPEAETEEEVKSSYLGKVIVNCNICHSHIFKNSEDIEVDGEGIVNADEACPYCGELEGFVIVGQITEFNPNEDASDEDADTEEIDLDDAEDDANTENNEDDEPVEAAEDDEAEEMEESLKLHEDFKEVSVTTDDQHMEMTSDENGKVTITTEPVAAEVADDFADEQIAPVDDVVAEEILDNSEEVPAEEPADETEEEIEEFDEESFDELGESFLRDTYENVKSYKTTGAEQREDHMLIEGVITFNSGKAFKTGFVFEAKYMNKDKKCIFEGYNKQLAGEGKAFNLSARIENKKLISESLKYDFKLNESLVSGIAKAKK